LLVDLLNVRTNRTDVKGPAPNSVKILHPLNKGEENRGKSLKGPPVQTKIRSLLHKL